jgi:hypothetical protein
MTEIISGAVHSLFGGTPNSFQMPDRPDHDWQQRHHPHHPHGYYNPQMPMLTSHWGDTRPHNHPQQPGQPAHMGGMQDVDLRMFQHDCAPYTGIESYEGTTGGLISPGISYQAGDPNWPSDVDMATPSTAGFPQEVQEGYHAHLRPPPGAGPGSASSQSPKSSHAHSSPQDWYARDTKRPAIGRSITAPESRHPRATATYGEAPVLKRNGTSEDGDDDDYVPGAAEDTKGRGRKRQRIPHTAVERRYRENLNAHLDKLRQTVPALASRSKPGEGAVEGVKPSKCEILNGAIEHIGALDKENRALKDEVRMLKSKLEDVSRRYHRGSALGA